MKNFVCKIGVGILSFLIGLISVYFLFIEKQNQFLKQPEPITTENKLELLKENKIEFLKQTNFENLPQNPYELEIIINENSDYFPVDKLWEKFDIDSEMKTLDNPFFVDNGKSNSVYFSSCHSCKADIFVLNLDSSAENEVLLGIGDYGGYGNYRFLAFKKLENGWRFSGYTDHDFNKYYSPKVRMENFNGERFLVLTCLGGSGTGISLSFERWYKLENKQLKEILSFPSEGYESMTASDLQREFKTSVKNHSAKIRKKYFEVEFINNFAGFSEDCKSESKPDEWNEIQLFQTKKIGYYVQNKKGIYQLNEKLSQISQDEIEKAYIPFGLNQKEFKEFYPNKIKEILREEKSCRAKWLKHWFSLDR